MALRRNHILICIAAVGLLAITFAFMAPFVFSDTTTQSGRKSNKKQHRDYGSIAGAAEGLNTEVNLKSPSEKERNEACDRLKKHGITPDIYEEAILQAIHDGCFPILADLLLAGQNQETLNHAFDYAITHTPNNIDEKNVKKNISVRLLVKAGAYEDGITPEQLCACQDRETDRYIRNAPQFESGNTLDDACMAGDYHAAKKLIFAGASLTTTSEWLTPFDITMIKKDTRMAKLILKHSNLDTKQRNRWLQRAVQHNMPEIAKLLLESDSGLNLNAALKWADRRKSDECIALLLNTGHFKHTNWKQRLTDAINNGHSYVISAVCKHIDVRQCHYIAHIEAIANDDADKLSQLQQQEPFSANSNIWESCSFLSLAARCGSVKCLKLLLSQPKAKVFSAFLADAAKGKGSAECVKELLKHPLIYVNDITAIKEIFNTRNHEIIEQLIQHPDFDVNQESNPKSSLLAFCSENFYISTLIKLLSKEGADPNIHHTHRDGRPSALYTAALCGNIVAIKILLAHGADPMLRGNSPHHLLEYAKIHAATEYISEKFVTAKYMLKERVYTTGKTHNKKLGRKCIKIIQEACKKR